MEIERAGESIYLGHTSTDQMRRSFDELAAHLGSALSFPVGAFLLTGTPLVPDQPFTLSGGDLVRITIEGIGTLENPVEEVGTEVEPAR